MATSTASGSPSTTAHLHPTSVGEDLEPDDAWKESKKREIEAWFAPMVQEAKDRLEFQMQALKVPRHSLEWEAQRKIHSSEFEMETEGIRNLAKEEFAHSIARERALKRIAGGVFANVTVEQSMVEEQASIMAQIQKSRDAMNVPTQRSTILSKPETKGAKIPVPAQGLPRSRSMAASTGSRSSSTTARLHSTSVGDFEPDEAWKEKKRQEIEAGLSPMLHKAKVRLESQMQALEAQRKVFLHEFETEAEEIKKLGQGEFTISLARERVSRRIAMGSVNDAVTVDAVQRPGVQEAEGAAKQIAEEAHRKAEEIRLKTEATLKKETELLRQQEETERKLRTINQRKAEFRQREEQTRQREEGIRMKEAARQREEAEKQRNEKERRRAEADKQRLEAEQRFAFQQREAEETRLKEVARQREEAEMQKKDKERQRVERRLEAEQQFAIQQREAEIKRKADERRGQGGMYAESPAWGRPATMPARSNLTTGTTWSSTSKPSPTTSTAQLSRSATPSSRPTWTAIPPSPYVSSAGRQADASPSTLEQFRKPLKELEWTREQAHQAWLPQRTSPIPPARSSSARPLSNATPRPSIVKHHSPVRPSQYA
ncbi:hypothetical protein DFH06DRAFT_1299885 [Mycena polygramma]|nr:hypothetical protein DFH06DRAFT_1299885 [Mycena polygramma]